MQLVQYSAQFCSVGRQAGRVILQTCEYVAEAADDDDDPGGRGLPSGPGNAGAMGGYSVSSSMLRPPATKTLLYAGRQGRGGSAGAAGARTAGRAPGGGRVAGAAGEKAGGAAAGGIRWGSSRHVCARGRHHSSADASKSRGGPFMGRDKFDFCE